MTRVKVNGEGKSRGKPDVATIQVRVQNEDKDQLECRKANNVACESVVLALKEVVEENDIHVVPACVSPKYKSGIIGMRVSGYQGSNTVTAVIRKLELAQQLVQTINTLDENLIQVSSFQYDIENKSELENVARRAAFANAKDRAETYSQEVGVEISGVESIDEHLTYVNTARYPSGKFGMVRLNDTNDWWIPTREEEERLETGDVELKVSVQVCFILGEKSRTEGNDRDGFLHNLISHAVVEDKKQ